MEWEEWERCSWGRVGGVGEREQRWNGRGGEREQREWERWERGSSVNVRAMYNYSYVKGMCCQFHVLKFLIFLTDGPSGHFLPLK